MVKIKIQLDGRKIEMTDNTLNSESAWTELMTLFKAGLVGLGYVSSNNFNSHWSENLNLIQENGEDNCECNSSVSSNEGND